MQLENPVMTMTFDREGRLTKLAGAGGRIQMPIDADRLTAPFMIALRTPQGEIVEVVPQAPPQMECVDLADAAQINLTWVVSDTWGSLKVRASVALPREARLSAWTIAIDNHTAMSIWQVAYPRISGLTPFAGDGSADYIAAPKGMGQLCHNPIALANRHHGAISQAMREEYGTLGMEADKNAIAFSYPGMWAMQYLALGHPDLGGIYFAAHDGQALYKRFGLYGDGGDGKHAALVMKQYPEDRTAAGAHFGSFYPCLLGIYEGGWWAASEIYRAWALRQKWCQRGATKDRPDIPAWTKQLDLWYWNWQFANAHGNHPKNLIPILAYIKQRFNCEVAFHWYGCNGENGITSPWRGPDIYPENATIQRTLKKAVADIHALGVRCIPYINPRIWCEADDDFRRIDGQKWITVDEHGRSADTWGVYGPTMCPTAQPAQEIMRRIFNRMVDDFGMDGAYFDQISSCYAVPCFNPDHDHGPGGHDHWCRGYRELLEKAQGDAKRRSPDTIITSESTIECYLDLLDLDLAREISNMFSKFSDPYSLPIPMFHSVYHDYHMTYGTVSTFKSTTREPVRIELFRFAEALCLVGGGQLMISGVFGGDQAKEQYRPFFDYMAMLAQAHKAGRKFLNLGVWKPPLELSCERTEIVWLTDQPPKRNIPAVLNGCFELAGELGLVLVNHTAQARLVEFTLAPKAYGLAGEAFELWSVCPGAETRLARLGSQGAKQSLTVPPTAALVLILKSEAPR